MKTIKKIALAFNSVRLLPHIVVYFFSKNKETIQYDVKRWISMFKKYDKNTKLGFIILMTFHPQFRNLFYKRIGDYAIFIRWLCPPMNTLFICTKRDNIGPGLFIQHGFSTIIAAEAIGKDCWINQQVTIGYSYTPKPPVLGNNVKIGAGAKIIGDVYMGDNSTAGANAVVVKNVPQNATVVGIPAHIVKKNGIKVHKKLLV